MSLSQKMVALSNRLTKRFRENSYKYLPIQEFDQKHIKNLVSLINREEMLAQLPKNCTIAEIGVFQGEFAEKILSITNPKKLILMDSFIVKNYPGLFEKVKDKFSDEVKNGKVEMVKELSFDGIQLFDNHFFDWVYLDTDHTYYSTKKELDLLRLKIKPGGIIAGHDYIVGNWNRGTRFGVIEAVHEFCVKYNWEMIFLTHELKIPPSYAIREIGF